MLWSVAASCCWSLLVVGCRFVVAVVAAAAEAVLGRRCETRRELHTEKYRETARLRWQVTELSALPWFGTWAYSCLAAGGDVQAKGKG